MTSILTAVLREAGVEVGWEVIRMPRARWLIVAIVASGCHGLKACDPPRPVEYLPVKLWSCTALEKHCEVYARFKTPMDCSLYQQLLGSACDLPAPPGEMHCRKTSSKAFHAEWFFECSKGDLTFAEVRDGGGWVR